MNFSISGVFRQEASPPPVPLTPPLNPSQHHLPRSSSSAATMPATTTPNANSNASVLQVTANTVLGRRTSRDEDSAEVDLEIADRIQRPRIDHGTPNKITGLEQPLQDLTIIEEVSSPVREVINLDEPSSRSPTPANIPDAIDIDEAAFEAPSYSESDLICNIPFSDPSVCKPPPTNNPTPGKPGQTDEEYARNLDRLINGPEPSRQKMRKPRPSRARSGPSTRPARRPKKATAQTYEAPPYFDKEICDFSFGGRSYDPKTTMTAFQSIDSDFGFLRPTTAVRRFREKRDADGMTEVVFEQIVLKGMQFRRSRELWDMLPKKLNEVAMVARLAELPMNDIVRARRLILTNANFPVHRGAIVLGGDAKARKHAEENERLVCRWVVKLKGGRNAVDNFQYEGSILRLTEEEADPNYKVQDEWLRNDWKERSFPEMERLMLAANEEVDENDCEAEGPGCDGGRLRNGTPAPEVVGERGLLDILKERVQAKQPRKSKDAERRGRTPASMERERSETPGDMTVSSYTVLNNPLVLPTGFKSNKEGNFVDLTNDFPEEIKAEEPVYAPEAMEDDCVMEDYSVEKDADDDLVLIEPGSSSGHAIKVLSSRALNSAVLQPKTAAQQEKSPPVVPSQSRPTDDEVVFIGVRASPTPDLIEIGDVPPPNFVSRTARDTSVLDRATRSPSIFAVSVIGLPPQDRKSRSVSTCTLGRSRTPTPFTLSPPPNSKSSYTFGDAFCGGGGMSCAARAAQLKNSWGFDHNLPAIRTYQQNFKEAQAYLASANDFLKTESKNCRVDVLHLSPPCQPHSPAHTIAGRDDEANEASMLCITEMLKFARPRMATLEQTFGILYRQQWFRSVINSFTSIGFSVKWKLIRCIEHGLPQDRKRLFVMASRPGERLPVWPEAKYAYRDPLKTETYNDAMEPQLSRPRTVRDAIGFIPDWATDHIERPFPNGYRHPAVIWDGPAKTIMAGGAASDIHPCGMRPFTVRELACLQTFPYDHVFLGNLTQQRKQIGNAVPPLVGKALLGALRKQMERADGWVEGVELEELDEKKVKREIVELEGTPEVEVVDLDVLQDELKEEIEEEYEALKMEEGVDGVGDLFYTDFGGLEEAGEEEDVKELRRDGIVVVNLL